VDDRIVPVHGARHIVEHQDIDMMEFNIGVWRYKIKDADGVIVLKQFIDNIFSNESRSAGYKYFHLK
jgi:hypothetical protein